jgi:Ca2+/Na+ antiporter
VTHWVYSAVIVAIGSSVLGLIVSALVIRRVFHGDQPRPAIALLLVSLLGLALAQLVEQTRVLVFRASYDGLIDPEAFRSVYEATWNVTSSKVLFACSFAAAAAVKLGLYCDRPDTVITRWAAIAAVATFASWITVAMALAAFS